MENEQQEEKQRVDELMKIDSSEATPEQFAEMQKIAKSSFEQKSHWKGKAVDPKTGKSWRSIVTDAKTDEPNKVNEQQKSADKLDDDAKQRIDKLELSEEKRQFGGRNQLTPEETDIVFAHAKGMGINPDDALKNSFMDTALKAYRRDKETNSATPGPSSRSPKVGGKTFSELSEKERKENWGKITGSQK